MKSLEHQAMELNFSIERKLGVVSESTLDFYWKELVITGARVVEIDAAHPGNLCLAKVMPQ